MLVPPELDEVVYGKRGMLRAIELAMEHECLVSAVSLMYATIDALAALGRPEHKLDNDRSDFVDWVGRYLEPDKGLGCSALDLYAARCGVLHAYSARSRLVRKGDARPLIYRWKAGPEPRPDAHLPADALVVAPEDLHTTLNDGIRLFWTAIENDDALRNRVKHHLPSLFCYVPWPP